MALEPMAENFGPLGNIQRWGTAAPSAAGDGTFKVGDIVWNTAPSASNPSYWQCVTAGSPGTWKAVNLAA